MVGTSIPNPKADNLMFRSLIRMLAAVVTPILKRPKIVQFAALCICANSDKTQIVLITSSNGRWIIPKGWPENGKSGAETAALEAWEEAGVISNPEKFQFAGRFDTVKERDSGLRFDCETFVYVIPVDELSDDYPEISERDRRLVDLDTAPDEVDDADLSDFLRHWIANR